MQVYILMQSAGGPCRAALRVSSVSGVGAAAGVTERARLPH